MCMFFLGIFEGKEILVLLVGLNMGIRKELFVLWYICIYVCVYRFLRSIKYNIYIFKKVYVCMFVWKGLILYGKDIFFVFFSNL